MAAIGTDGDKYIGTDGDKYGYEGDKEDEEEDDSEFGNMTIGTKQHHCRYPPNLLATLADLMCQQIAEANNCLHIYTLLSITKLNQANCILISHIVFLKALFKVILFLEMDFITFF